MKGKILQLDPEIILEKKRKSLRKENNKEEELFLRTLADSLGLGFSISLPIVLSVIVGVYLDRKWHFYPAMTLFFVCLGVAGAILAILRITKQ